MKKLLAILLSFLTLTAFSQVTKLPGKIEAEMYSSMSGIQLEQTSDIGGGLDVGYIDKGDFMQYGIQVDSPGTYTVSFRVAALNLGAQFQVVNGNNVVLATVNVPKTGGYQTWATVTAVVTLAAGIQNIQLTSTGTANWNINWLSFSTLSVIGPVVIPPITATPLNFYGPLDSLAATFDSVIVKNRSTAAVVTLNIDTITTPNISTYLISARGFNPATGDAAFAVSLVGVKFFNGIYSVDWIDPIKPWAGEGTLAKTSWAFVVIGNVLQVQITTVANPTNFTYKKYSL